ncbi:hypothetical protein HPP92_006581, partial [Vanilla planifolia]
VVEKTNSYIGIDGKANIAQVTTDGSRDGDNSRNREAHRVFFLLWLQVCCLLYKVIHMREQLVKVKLLLEDYWSTGLWQEVGEFVAVMNSLSHVACYCELVCYYCGARNGLGGISLVV